MAGMFERRLLIQDIEERCLNACPPLQQVLYDGWVIRLANGYTRRANSASPIYPGHRDPVDKIPVCEALYREHGLRPVFKMTPLDVPDHRTLDRGTLRAIIRQTGLSVNEFLQLIS